MMINNFFYFDLGKCQKAHIQPKSQFISVKMKQAKTKSSLGHETAVFTAHA